MKIVFVSYAILASALSLSTPAQSTARKFSQKDFSNIVAKTRTEKDVESRTIAAEHLYDLIKTTRPGEVDARSIDTLVTLLNAPDDSVRLSIAMCLGHLGIRAKIAIPKLLELLPKADCDRTDLGSAAGIRYALKQMKTSVPPYPECDDFGKPKYHAKRSRP